MGLMDRITGYLHHRKELREARRIVRAYESSKEHRNQLCYSWPRNFMPHEVVDAYFTLDLERLKNIPVSERR